MIVRTVVIDSGSCEPWWQHRTAKWAVVADHSAGGGGEGGQTMATAFNHNGSQIVDGWILTRLNWTVSGRNPMGVLRWPRCEHWWPARRGGSRSGAMWTARRGGSRSGAMPRTRRCFSFTDVPLMLLCSPRRKSGQLLITLIALPEHCCFNSWC